MASVGLISDTHGLLRNEALEALAGVDQIIHAGDVGKPEILEKLRAVAPVVAVRGNVDKWNWADELPETAVIAVGQASFFVLHDVKQIDQDPATAGFSVVVSGHSHKAGKSGAFGCALRESGECGAQTVQLAGDDCPD